MKNLLTIIALSLISISANADSWAWDSEETVLVSKQSFTSEKPGWAWDDEPSSLQYDAETSWNWE